MKPIPVAYKAPKGTPLGRFNIAYSPDGWVKSCYEADSMASPPMNPTERLEFIKLTNDFIHRISSREDLDKYVRQYGKVIVKDTLPTYGILFQEDKLTYEMQVTGVIVTITPYRRKEKAK